MMHIVIALRDAWRALRGLLLLARFSYGWSLPLLGAIALSLPAACADEVPPTQVIVTVATDLALGSELARVDVQLLDTAGRNAGAAHSFVLAADGRAGTVTAPFSFGVARGRAAELTLRVSGYAADVDAAVITYQTRVRFVPEQTLLLEVFLARGCYRVACGAGETCASESASAAVGACGPIRDAHTGIVRPGEEVETFATLPQPSSGPATSDGGIDAQVDAREDAARSMQPDADGARGSADAHDDHAADAGAASGERDAPPFDAAPHDASRGAMDPCFAAPCEHGGKCEASGAAATCDCSGTGYTGARCETDVDECASDNACVSADYPCVQTTAPGYVCAGQFADWHMPSAAPGAKFEPNYDLSVPGVTIDRTTGLMWQREIPPVYAGCSGFLSMRGDRCTQPEAKVYCDQLQLAGKDDWRLPSAIELASLVDETKRAPAIDETAFPNTPGNWHWTSSSFVGATLSAWEINFETGVLDAVADNAISHDHVRCVRNVEARRPAMTRYVVDATADTITDARTGLVWHRAVQRSQSFAMAATTCAALGAGFRMPALTELLTLLDFVRLAPSIDPLFASTPSQLFWTGSPLAGSTTEAWAVNFATGHAHEHPSAMGLPSRCVR